MKKSQWATPSGIDHDYNYLKSVERHIDEAADNVRHTSDGHGEVTRHVQRQWRDDSSLQRYLSKHKIDVQHAPAGMSRSRSNKTRVTQTGKVFWTVEWADMHGVKLVENDCGDNSSISDLHTAFLARHAKEKRRLHAASGETSTKRRRTDEPISTQSGVTPIHDESAEKASTPDSTLAQNSDEVAKNPALLHYYLQIPNTKTKTTVLIPLDKTQSLTSCLSERTLQEYPTIFALPLDMEELPDDFMLEQAYLEQRKSAGVDEPSKQHHEETVIPPRPSAAQILQMLRRDMSKS